VALTKLNLAQGVTGTLPNANFSGGKVLQTQQSLFTSSSNHTSESYTQANYNVSITPSATNSKIFVNFNFRHHIFLASGASCAARIAVFRQINGGGYSQFFPADANIVSGYTDGAETAEREIYYTPQITFMDTTHNTTNQIDYKLYARRDTATSGTCNIGGSSHQAQVIAMEIGA